MNDRLLALGAAAVAGVVYIVTQSDNSGGPTGTNVPVPDTGSETNSGSIPLPDPGSELTIDDIPAPSSPEGTAGTVDTDYGGPDGIANADNFGSARRAYLAELYDTDTGE